MQTFSTNKKQHNFYSLTNFSFPTNCICGSTCRYRSEKNRQRKGHEQQACKSEIQIIPGTKVPKGSTRLQILFLP
jgi:hypothetical protein